MSGGLTELLRDLVAIDSVNPTLVAGGAGEREIAGGDELSSYPGRCVVELERRTLPE